MPAQPAYDQLLRDALIAAVEHIRAAAAADPSLSGAAARAESVLSTLAKPARDGEHGASVRDDLVAIIRTAGHALIEASEPSLADDAPLTEQVVHLVRAKALRDAADRYDDVTEGEWLHRATTRYTPGFDVPAQWLRDLAADEIAAAGHPDLLDSVEAVLEQMFPDLVLAIGADDIRPEESGYYRDGDWRSFTERTHTILRMRRAAAATAVLDLIAAEQVDR